MWTKKLAFLSLIFICCSFTIAGEVLFLQPGAAEYIGVYELRAYEPNLTGNGVTVGAICRSITYENGVPLNDFGVNTSHPCFSRSNISHHSQFNESFDFSDHSTAIASILVADNQGAFYPQLGSFYYEGVCPDVKLNIYEFWHFVRDYIFSQKETDIDILTISSGTTDEQWWTRGIERLASKGITVVAGAGNGTESSDPILYPGGSANVIGVGVADCVIDSNLSVSLANFGLPNSEHSSIGPATNGCSKPDIIAPGSCIVADLNDSYTISGNYSSFATPIVAGSAALLTQKINENFSEDISKTSRNIFIKSIIMTSADKLAYWHKGLPDAEDDHETALDYAQGAGLINLTTAMDLLTSDINESGWRCKTLNSNEILDFYISDTLAGKELTATLAWNYQFEETYPFNITSKPNLRLELWASDINDPNAGDTLIDYSDCKAGTVEHLHLKVKAGFENFRISVKHVSNSGDDPVDFALSWIINEHDNNFDPILFYDLNNDGIVNHADFLNIINNIGKASQGPKKVIYGDINLNGKIDSSDLNAVIKQKDQKAFWKN